MSARTPGRIAYESDLLRRPLYHDGTPRKTWDQLGAISRWSWERELVERMETKQGKGNRI
jgi:hypothetical protein